MNKLRITSEFDPRADFILYEGDCLDLLPQIRDGFVKLVATSPPYNLGKPYESRLDLDEYLAQQRTVIEDCVRVLDDRGSICWQVGNYVDNGKIIPLDIVLYPIFASLGLHLRNRIVWHFGHGLHASKRFSGRVELPRQERVWMVQASQSHVMTKERRSSRRSSLKYYGLL